MLKNLDSPNLFGSDLVYRGQSVDWDLLPKIFRYKTIPKSANNFVGFEERIHHEFIQQSRPFLDSEPKNILEWLAIAQHHGTPTRFLDWTFSPLVALYFAVENEDEDSEYGVIWALWTENIYKLPEEYPNFRNIDSVRELHKQLDTSIESATVEKQYLNGYLYTPAHINTRIIAQQACLTIHTFPPVALNTCKTLSYGLVMRKYIIPSSSKPTIRRELARIGITPFQIYPDLEGISKSIEWRIKFATGEKMNLTEIHSYEDEISEGYYRPSYYWNPKTEQESRFD